MTERSVFRWQRNLYFLAVAQFFSTLGFQGVSPLLPLFVQDLGVRAPSEAAFWTGVAHFAGGFCSFLAGPLWGAMADRYGRRTMVLRSTAAGAVILAITGLSPNLAFLIVMRSLHGALTGVNAASFALAVSQAPQKRTAFALGIVQMAFFLGTMAGPLLGGFLADSFGYRAPFFVTGGLLVVSFLVVLLFVREKFEPPPETKERLHPLRNVRMVLGLPNVVPLLGMLLVTRCGPFMLFPVMAVFMQEMVAQGAATMAGLAFALLGLASALASVLIGRWGQSHNLHVAVLVAAFGASAFYLPQAWVRSPGASLALFAIVGLFQGTLLTATNALLSTSVSRQHQGAVFGVVQSVNAMALASASLIAGTMSVAMGFRSIFVVDALMFFFMGMVALWMFKTQRRRLQKEGVDARTKQA
ncbi:MAG: MFS transporter [Dehalococcoidia bacterium]|nr:MFS transporter [Dehalococcoidia bacterium]